MRASRMASAVGLCGFFEWCMGKGVRPVWADNTQTLYDHWSYLKLLRPDAVANQLFRYLTVAEGLKLCCAQAFVKDMRQLSCCAGWVGMNGCKV